MGELPIAPMSRIVKNVGAKRVSKDAQMFLAQHLEEYAEGIAREAVRFSRHASRNTVKASDIVLAIEK